MQAIIKYYQADFIRTNVIGALQYTPVEDSTLLTFDTAALADGPYVIRLTVVDSTGNFPEPSEVSVVVANGGG